MVSGLVKILKVQAIVPDLVGSACGERVLANFELKHEQHVPKNNHGINSLSEARDRKLEENATFIAVRQKCRTQDVKLLCPGVALSRFYGVRTCLYKCVAYLCVRMTKKPVN